MAYDMVFWGTSTLAQCLASIIGFYIVALFWFYDKHAEILREDPTVKGHIELAPKLILIAGFSLVLCLVCMQYTEIHGFELTMRNPTYAVLFFANMLGLTSMGMILINVVKILNAYHKHIFNDDNKKS